MSSDKKITKNVFILGLVSFFNDVASEMVYPVVPIFLSTVIKAPVTAIGLIEGLAESSASLLKLISGIYSDKIKKRKPFVMAGYSLSSVAKIIIGAASSWPVVLVGRFTDRFGKGIRTSARDALIAESCAKDARGRAFGFHRALDTAGAVIGPLAAMLLIANSGENLRRIFFISFIPAVIGVALLFFFVKEKSSSTLPDSCPPTQKLSFASIDPQFKVFLISSVLFAIGNSSDAFLILRAKNMGFTTVQAIMAYVLFNLVYAVFSFPAGIVSDKVGAKKLLIGGFFFFSIIYLSFGIINKSYAYIIWLLFGLYGFYMAITEGVGKAYISELSGGDERLATSMGIYQFSVGIATFFASLIAGFLWSYISPDFTFIYGAGMSFLAGVLFIFLSKPFDFKNPKL